MKEKKIYKIENEAAKKNPRRNYIEYYVNEEKKTVTAVLTGVRQEMSCMFEKKFANAGFSALGNAWLLGRTKALPDVMKFVPDKIVATATCAPEYDFDVEFGCSLARMRLIEKLYKYFDPKYFFIKLSPINVNAVSEANNMGNGIIEGINLV